MRHKRSFKAEHVDFRLRLPPELHQALIEFADRQEPRLSLNKAIIVLLGDALDQMNLKRGEVHIRAGGFSQAQGDELARLIQEAMSTFFQREFKKKKLK
jgi:hypothetical protein